MTFTLRNYCEPNKHISKQYLLDLDPLDRDRDLRDDGFEPDLCECDLRELDLDLDLDN